MNFTVDNILTDLNTKNWREFKLKDIFYMYRGKRFVSAERAPGEIPYFSASSKNNGITDKISNALFIESNALVYTTFGDCYYFEEEFTASDEITILKHSNLNKYTGLFIATILNLNKYKYNFGRKAYSTLLEESTLKLPIKDNSIDFDFMENYMKSLNINQGEILNNIPDYFLDEGYERACWFMDNIDQEKFEQKYSKPAIEYSNLEINIDEWSTFKLSELFDIKKGKRLVSSEMVNGNTPYLGATSKNNGITNYISLDPLFQGNVITVNYDGSVGESFYQKEPFYCSDAVNVLIPKFKLNSYIANFIITIIKLEKPKYSYGRKWTLEKMNNTEIKLPVKNNSIDFDFMENYIKSLNFSNKI